MTDTVEEAQRWRRVEEVAERAFDMDEAERAGFLATALEDAPDLRSDVEDLLRADREAGGFLQRSAIGAWEDLCRTSHQEDGDGAAGRRIGPYRIQSLLGRGGMATVFRAVRDDDEFRRQVAVKLISQVATEDQVRRFRRERQILADFDHPGIARLLDGGTTEDGLPYFVMEIVEGTPLIAYCDRRALSRRQRLELFQQICDAVQCAHRNLVVHRDLKSDNILVSDEGIPKLLDFGIAKFLDPLEAEVRSSEIPGPGSPSAERGMPNGGPASQDPTLPGQRLLTPNYASPEQLRGEALTTATDVYSLGVLLYRLLTGRLPRRFPSLRPQQVEAVLAERLPPAGIGGDLELLLGKALQVDPALRYTSVEQLSEDIRRFLQGLPLIARPATLGYRTGKFLRRHRVASTVAISFVALLTGFAFDKARQARQLALKTAQAETEQVKAQHLSSFLLDILRGSDPWRTAGREPTLRQALDDGARNLRHNLQDQPEIRADLLNTIGTIYLRRGDYDVAGEHLEESLILRRKHLEARHPEIAETLNHLGVLHNHRGLYDEAEAFHREALEIRIDAFGPDTPPVAESYHNLAAVLFLQGHLPAAEGANRLALDILRQHFGEQHKTTAGSRTQLAAVLIELDRLDSAEELLQDALAAQRSNLGDAAPQVAVTLTRLASLRNRQGRYTEAEPLFREALAIRRPIFGDEHPEVGQSLNNLAISLREQGKLQEAEQLYLEVLEVARKSLGEGHRDVAVVFSSLGRVKALQGHSKEAEAYLRRSLGIVRSSLPEGHPGAAYPLQQLAQLILQSPQPAKAEPLLREALALRAGALPPGHVLTAETRGLLGTCLVRTGKREEAIALLQRSRRELGQELGDDHPKTAAVRKELAALAAPS